MSKIDNGGYVHANKSRELIRGNAKGNTEYGDVVEGGITRRDECADRIAAELSGAVRIAGMLAANKGIPSETFDKLMENSKSTSIARSAYELADALIAEGRKGE